MTEDPHVNTTFGSAGTAKAIDPTRCGTDHPTAASVRRASFVRIIALALMAQGVLSIPLALVEPAGKTLLD